MSEQILIVDDEPGIRESLRHVLEDEGYAVDTAATGEECLTRLAQRRYACVLLDVWLPGMDGLKTLPHVKQANTHTSVVMISGHGTIETAVRATKLGAFDFLEKPLSLEKTVVVVRNAVRQYALEVRTDALQEEVVGEYEMVGESVAMRALRKQIAIVAPTDGRVLIYGESGTGKELVARAIHHGSRRAREAFVELNCAAIPEELIESELFGHVKGAFTGATQTKRGKFEIADRATLFLDEIGDMSLKVQAKVLRALEENRFEPVGTAASVRVDARVISATNKHLETEIERGGFRPDLFYRLNVIPFEVPPLRERLEDVPALVEHFNRKFSTANKKTPKVFSRDALDALQNYSWQGNVRELRNTIERVVIMLQKDRVTESDLPALGSGEPFTPPAAAFRFQSFREASEQYQREYIRRKLAEAEGNVTKAAEAMGVDRSHLYRRMRALGIQVGSKKDEIKG